MHFALPPRKSSSPPPYVRAGVRSIAQQRRKQVQYLSLAVLCVLSIYLLYGWVYSTPITPGDGTVPHNPSFLVVTVFDETTMSEDYMTMIKANRDDYAARHGYRTFYTNTSTYKSLYQPAPSSWALLPALRGALTLHPDINYIWSLSPHAIITNFTLNLYAHIIQPLPNLMIKDIPVVPPDSVIHTFSHLTASSTNLIITQDNDNLAHTSFILRNTIAIPQLANRPKDTWTHYFLDAWFDPLYRAYAFQKAENHALEHIVQWHPTILANLVILEQRRLNSYNFQYPRGQLNPDTGLERKPADSMWQQGDLVVNFKGCTESSQRDCEKEMRDYFERWREQMEKEDGQPVDVKLKISMRDYVSKVKGANGRSTESELKRTHA